MGLLDQLWGRSSPRPGMRTRYRSHRYAALRVEPLEPRHLLDATGVLAGGVLTITGNPVAYDNIRVSLDPATNLIVLRDNGNVAGTFANAAVGQININSQAHFNVVRVDSNVIQQATIRGGPGTNFLFAGGGVTQLVGGPGYNRLVGGPANDVLDGSLGGTNTFFGDGSAISLLTNPAGTGNTYIGATATNTQFRDTVAAAQPIGGPSHDFFFGNADRDAIVAGGDPLLDRDLRGLVSPGDLSDFLGLTPDPNQGVTLTAAEVGQLLARAAAVDGNDDGIVAIVDRSGRILGVRVMGKVDPAITGNTAKLVFSIDGAVALARTGAFFGNNQAPLTSRTIQFISQTTITQREVQSDPSVTDVNSPFRGPGFVAPIGIGGHFPPGVMNTPQVDLFQIEGTNRDTTFHPGPSGIAGAPDQFQLPQRFNIDPKFIPSRIPVSQFLAPPNSYGLASGLAPNAQPRGIGTLPGGVPILKNGEIVGGIGVFFPGKTGFADEENAHIQGSTFDPNRPDRSLEAEFVAITALGGNLAAANPSAIGNNGVAAGVDLIVGQNVVVGGIPPVAGLSLPFGRIDLVGITLPIFGPEGDNGPQILLDAEKNLPPGDPNSGFNAPLLNPGPDNQLATGDEFPQPGNLLNGTPVPEGFIVEPHDGLGITAAQVRQIIAQAINQAQQTRAAIRLPFDSPTKMVIAVCDLNGNIVGLFREPDATIFSIDVAVAKSRNVAYYANPAQVQAIDLPPGVTAGNALTNRTFRFLAEPFFPEGIDAAPPGPFSLLNDPGTNPKNALNTGAPVPSSAFFDTVMGHDAFFPGTNFHNPFNLANQNGIVFFPGSVPLYANGNLIGGEGTSGDGVDQDDVVTFAAKQGFDTPANVLRADQVFVRDIRLPYQKTNRQPELSPPTG